MSCRVEAAVSVARARNTYSPGRVNVALKTAFPSSALAAGGVNVTAPGPRHTNQDTCSRPVTLGGAGRSTWGTLTGVVALNSELSNAGGRLALPPPPRAPRPRGAGNPSSVTVAVSVNVSVTAMRGAPESASVGGLFAATSPPLPLPVPVPGTAISQSGRSHPTARSDCPWTTNVQTSSFLPQSPGTVTEKS